LKEAIRQKMFALFAILLLLSGCGFGGGYAPVFSSGEERRSSVQVHTVRSGETLYSIAFRYGLDYKQIADANGIAKPYVIFANQKLRLAGKRVPPVKKVRKSAPKVVAEKSNNRSPKKSQDSKIDWRWPIAGEVIKPFSLTGDVNKGVDIAGRLGESVMAAADGVVVYAGGGLRGYGKLVIVKHSDQYLSAYGHNRSIRVKEGQKIKGGQVVAEIGSSGTDREMLHFEIRRDGKPADPLIYLPDR
jgi:lipoprotein NlpD